MQHEPVQKRSKESLERIMAAAEELMQTRNFRSIGVAEIAERAGVAPSLIYTRFDGKDAMVPALTNRFFQRYIAALDAEIDRPVDSSDPEACIARMIETVYRLSRDNIALLRIIAEHQLEGSPVLEGETAELNRQRIDRMTDWLGAALADCGYRVPTKKLRTAISVITTVVQVRLLFDTPAAHNVDEAALRKELRDMFGLYLAQDMHREDSAAR